METINDISRKSSTSRYFLIQPALWTASSRYRPQVMIWATSKDTWDQIEDGALSCDKACMPCKACRKHQMHDASWTAPDDCLKDRNAHSATIYNTDNTRLQKVEDKNWKVVFHGQRGEGRWVEAMLELQDWRGSFHDNLNVLYRTRKRKLQDSE